VPQRRTGSKVVARPEATGHDPERRHREVDRRHVHPPPLEESVDELRSPGPDADERAPGV
jgi:hypothetical protein